MQTTTGPASARLPGTQVPRVKTVSRGEFQRRWLRARTPVMVEEPPAWPREVWSPAALEARGRGVGVELEVGNVMRGATRIQRATLDAYIRRYLGGGTQGDDEVPYLSVFDLLAHLPELRAAMDFSLFRGAKRFERIRAWLGPAGTLTGFHTDLADNLLYQAHGRKHVSLVPPACDAFMYPGGKYDFMSVPSAVDEARPAAFPLFERAREERMETELEPGQVLYIPFGWWHRVESLSGSISVNCFAWSWAELPGYLREIARYAAHHAGFLGTRGPAGCVCHTPERPGGTGLLAKFPGRFRG